MIIRVEHGYECGYCSKGMRAFCNRYGFDYIDFCHNGIEEEKLIATGDHMVLAMVERAHGRV